MPIQPRARQKGFTLIELLIVVAIIGILTAIAIPALIDAQDRARQSATAQTMNVYTHSLSVHYTDNSGYPVEDAAAAGRQTVITNLTTALVPYSTTVLPPLDGWQHLFWYQCLDSENYVLRSFGKDDVPDSVPPWGPGNGGVTPSTRDQVVLDIVVVNGTLVNSPF